MTAELAGTIALITGGSRGIGLATATAFVARGAKVCITGRKAALLHMTRQLAYELGPGVRVNAVFTALVRTRFAQALWASEAELLRHYPLGRLGVPEDVAEAIVFLASPRAAAWITGESLTIDGGMLVNDSVSVPVKVGGIATTIAN